MGIAGEILAISALNRQSVSPDIGNLILASMIALTVAAGLGPILATLADLWGQFVPAPPCVQAPQPEPAEMTQLKTRNGADRPGPSPAGPGREATAGTGLANGGQ